MSSQATSDGGWSGQVSLSPPIATPNSPAAATFNGVIYVMYRTISNDGVAGFTFDGVTVYDFVASPYDPRTSTGVGVAVYKNRLYVANLGKDSPTIWCSSFDGSGWSPQTNVTDRNGCESTKTPALASFGGKLYMAYRGANSDTLRYCTFDGSTWSDQSSIKDANGAQSSDAPALAVYDDKLYMVYRGKSGSTNLWYCYHDGERWSAQSEITDESGKNVKGPQTGAAVGLAAFDKKLYMVYRGKDSSNMWACAFDGSKWEHDETDITAQNSAETSKSPALAVLDDKLYAIYRGQSSDQVYSCYVSKD